MGGNQKAVGTFDSLDATQQWIADNRRKAKYDAFKYFYAVELDHVKQTAKQGKTNEAWSLDELD